MTVDIEKYGISIKLESGLRKAFAWGEVEDLQGSPLPIGKESVPWEDVQAVLDEEGVDLASQEMQDKIIEIKELQKPEPLTQEEKDRKTKRNQLADEVRTTATPTAMPDLAGRVNKIEQILGLKPIDL